MASYDVDFGQCKTIFGAAEADVETAETSRHNIVGDLESLMSSAQRGVLRNALGELKDEALLPQMDGARIRLATAASAGFEMLQIMSESDELMRGESDRGLARAVVDAHLPGTGR
ncbi:hypothetical protein [Zhihengliuella salsuginis]|uniref:hypothetical protein n=1 Tax=Zhihengliuella salsuginis TaxID=578222 RepID=UPI0016766AFA|nr:hypothetical protein [Zhihengliuella salsuginis]